MATEEQSLRNKDYGPLTLTVASGCHRYESRMTSDRWFLGTASLIFASLMGAMGYWMTSTPFFEIARWFLPVFVAIGLFLLWGAITSVRQKAILLITPDEMILILRGFFPFARNGMWRWGLDQLVEVAINTLPLPARVRPMFRSGIELRFSDSPDLRKTFFVFDSEAQAAHLRDDILASFSEMIAQHNALLDAQDARGGHPT